MTRPLLFLMLLFLALSPARAQQVMTFSADGERVAGEGSSGDGAELRVDWEAETKIGLLLGEPVVSARFRYALQGGTVTLPTSTALGASRYETHSLASLPRSAMDLIELYGVRLRLDFRGDEGDFHLIVDVGRPGPAGDWSFNVPGSPDWGTLFRGPGSTLDDPRYLSAGRAREEVRRGLTLAAGSIVEAHVTLLRLHQWYERENPDYHLKAYGAAIRHLEDGVRVSYGYNETTPEALETVFIKSVRDRLDFVASYERRYRKLLDIPDRFRTGGNHAPYEVARDQARRMIINARERAPRFESDQVNPGALHDRGHPPRFDGSGVAAAEPKGSTGQPKAPSGADQAETDGCRVRLFQHCEKPFNGIIEKAMFVAFRSSDLPADLCDSGFMALGYQRKTDDFTHPLDFPAQHMSEMKGLLRGFARHMTREHPECRIGAASSPTLQIIPPDPAHSRWTCTTDPKPLPHSVQICSGF
ncbi:hypothetical protein JYP49_05155 [Nitratireductor aquimarinus]|uniref:hypothetical protein n=1 Tax=Nitratireductor TaxID=245876 RepID=UPI0019D3CF2D|nr:MULTISPECIES: hypothetical protein [Nitratireductor]MBN7776633.1 hypothetical protein [Nitratireductor pacificus]MBN7779967.1 hypothetical protein [Nitratireductor pacificus]MBN7788774.1 hypothetical protein [Nitratireductor aquimarinus]MBY6098842.1 hypothetical protein [Nitratireductor aquimarinus]MCA1262928.1 hypothetical protein [Nitratireductor aquimarinus]